MTEGSFQGFVTPPLCSGMIKVVTIPKAKTAPTQSRDSQPCNSDFFSFSFDDRRGGRLGRSQTITMKLYVRYARSANAWHHERILPLHLEEGLSRKMSNWTE